MKTLAITKLPDKTIMTLILISILASFILAGCSTSQGRLSPNEAATSFFNNDPLPNDFQYYTSALPGSPVAFLAISKGYDLVSRNWEPVPPQAINISADQAGFSTDITGPDNHTIGKLYIAGDNYYEHTTVVMLDDRHIQVSVPVRNGSEEALYRLWGIEGTFY